MSIVTRIRNGGKPALALCLVLALLLVAGLVQLDRAWIAAHPEAAKAPAAAPRIGLAPGVLPSIAPPPRVEPKVFVPLPADQARATNAAIPFAASGIAPAAPFTYAGTALDRANALTCLAAAAYYEAGDDTKSEAAVAQVVINRVRHPAFPKTVCGVVFQGAERATGCQFTFACDGALARAPSPAAWGRARTVAEDALAGHVEKAVGTATHYHADYVVPYWHSTLTKLAEVSHQIFYRWPGWWGSPRAFTGRLQASEPIDPRLVGLGGVLPAAPFTGTAQEAADLFGNPHPSSADIAVPGVARGALQGSVVRLMDSGSGQYVLQLDAAAKPASYESAARALCKAKEDCIVMGWLHADHMPSAMPVPPPKMRTMAFLYRKSSLLGRSLVAWNCHQVTNADATRCLPGTE